MSKMAAMAMAKEGQQQALKTVLRRSAFRSLLGAVPGLGKVAAMLDSSDTAGNSSAEVSSNADRRAAQMKKDRAYALSQGLAVAPEVPAGIGAGEGNKDSLSEAIQSLADQRIPSDLAAQIGTAVAEALRKQPVQLVMPGENGPKKRTQAAKADDEGRT